MTRTMASVDPEQRLVWDAVKAKRDRQAAMDLVARLRRQVIAEVVRGKLLRLEDFYAHIGEDRVITDNGLVDVRAVEAHVTDLLRRRPELGVGPDRVGGSR